MTRTIEALKCPHCGSEDIMQELNTFTRLVKETITFDNGKTQTMLDDDGSSDDLEPTGEPFCQECDKTLSISELGL